MNNSINSIQMDNVKLRFYKVIKIINKICIILIYYSLDHFCACDCS